MEDFSKATAGQDDSSRCADLELLARNDPKIPRNWSARQKWTVTLTACFVCFAVGLNATGIAGAPTPINERFGISDASFPNSFWPVASWTIGAAVVPMVILPLMEEYGVRPGYVICYTFLFFISVIPQAVAPNFSTLVSCRFFAGGAAGVLQNGMDGIIADIWMGAAQRSLPVTIYVTGLLAGISLGPVFWAAIVQNCYWRWILYIQLILYGIIMVIVLLVMKETRSSVIRKKWARRREKDGSPVAAPKEFQTSTLSPVQFIYDTIVLPAKLLCTEPVVFSPTLLSALSYGVVFISTQSVMQVFRMSYNLEEYQAGLVQASVVIGEIMGFVACLFQNAWYTHATNSNPEMSEIELSETRLYLNIPASFIGLTGGLFFYGWTSYPTLPWILPAVGLSFIGFGVTVVMQAIMMYVTDAYAKYAASASAAVCFGENIFAAFLPLAGQSMYTNLGFQWASSVLAFIALLLSFAPIVLVWKGKHIRERSHFMRKATYT